MIKANNDIKLYKNVCKRGDTLITLTCDKDLNLEQRVELLAYAFAKVVQGSILRTVVDWNISDGCIQFIIGDPGVRKVPRGRIHADLQDITPDTVSVETKNIKF